MSSPGREMPARAAASSPAHNDAAAYLASSPSPSIASHRQRHAQLLQQPTASEAAAQDQQQQHHHDDDDDSIIPPFEPVFTLLTNTTTNTTVHPRVHYLFSDDDASAVLTAPQTDPRHRALIVDLAPPANPSGKWSVSWASSLTPDFAVTASQLSLQQHGSSSSSGNNEGEDGASTSVMLRVEGVEREGVPAIDSTKRSSASLRGSSSSGGSGAGIVGREDVDQLTEEFRRRMGVLKKVVDEGERRRRETLNRLNEELPATHPDGRDDDYDPAVEEDATAGG
ncbi:hypothetical protein ACQKWADRAFT_279780 [Trichoderma austrokoningii]